MEPWSYHGCRSAAQNFFEGVNAGRTDSRGVRSEVQIPKGETKNWNIDTAGSKEVQMKNRPVVSMKQEN